MPASKLMSSSNSSTLLLAEAVCPVVHSSFRLVLSTFVHQQPLWPIKATVLCQSLFIGWRSLPDGTVLLSVP
jgi:hypothetical protein